VAWSISHFALQNIAQAVIEYAQRDGMSAERRAERYSTMRHPGKHVHTVKRTFHGIRHYFTKGMTQTDALGKPLVS
jgi:hypothetical protein